MTDHDDHDRRTDLHAALTPGSATAEAHGDDDLGPTRVRRSDELGLLQGSTLGEYRVLHQIGEGAMGVVYVGEHVQLPRKVAVKVLKRTLASDPEHVRRFFEEARALSASRHPNIVDVLTMGQTALGDPYLVMEFLEGEDLDAMLKKRREPLPIDEALDLLIPVLNGLSAAHAAGVIHRDLKPANIFVVTLHDGTLFPKLVDFGLARRGQVGAPLRQTSIGGTPLYVAPEQILGDPVTPATDLYSFGCLAYEVLTGKPPFTSGNLADIIEKHRNLAPRPPTKSRPALPRALEKVLLELLAKHPAERPQSALEVRQRLSLIREELSQARRTPAAAHPVERTPAAATTLPPRVAPVSKGLTTGRVVMGLAVIFVGAAVAGALSWKLFERPAPVVVEHVDLTNPQPLKLQPLVKTDAVKPADPVKPEAVKPEPVKPAPVVEEVVPQKPDAPVKTPRTPKTGHHTRQDVLTRASELSARLAKLPENLRRTATTQLEQVRASTDAPDDCWRDLDELEQTWLGRSR